MGNQMAIRIWARQMGAGLLAFPLSNALKALQRFRLFHITFVLQNIPSVRAENGSQKLNLSEQWRCLMFLPAGIRHCTNQQILRRIADSLQQMI